MYSKQNLEYYIKKLEQNETDINSHIMVSTLKGAIERVEELERRISSDTEQIARLETEVYHLKERSRILTGHLLVLLQDTWPYLHQWCTIQSIKDRWKEASNYIGKGEPK